MALVPLNREQEREEGIVRNTPFGDQGDVFDEESAGIVRPTSFGAGGDDGVQINRGSGFGRAGTGRPRIRRPQSARRSQSVVRGARDPAFNSFKEGFDFGAPKGVFTTPRGTFTDPRGTFVDDPSRFNRGNKGGRRFFTGF